MTNQQKRNKVIQALKIHPNKSTRWLAEICGVSRGAVDAIRNNPAPKDCVYFILCPQANRIKIGFTNNIGKRIFSHETSCPFPVIFLGSIPGNISMERKIHAQFKHLRKHLEWFEAGQELLDFISQNTNQVEAPST